MARKTQKQRQALHERREARQKEFRAEERVRKTRGQAPRKRGSRR